MELLDRVNEVRKAAAEAIQSPDDERVAGGEELEAGVELRAVLERPGADVVEHATTAGLLERVELQFNVLLVGRNTRVADQIASGPCRR